jgi:hypothetical protein
MARYHRYRSSLNSASAPKTPTPSNRSYSVIIALAIGWLCGAMFSGSVFTLGSQPTTKSTQPLAIVERQVATTQKIFSCSN